MRRSTQAEFSRRDFIVGGSLALAASSLGRTAEPLPVPPITTTSGVEEAFFIRAGGLEQWVQMRGEDRLNPVILCLNGGPGASWIPWSEQFVPWEKAFTVVLWDQRGEGQTQIRSGDGVVETYALERMQDDGVELARALCRFLGKRKVILLGHSWGAILGLHMLRTEPGLFHAYVGTGQIVHRQRGFALMYDYMMRKAQSANDESAIATLRMLGPGPYPPGVYKDASKVALHDAVWSKYQPRADVEAIASINKTVARYLQQFPAFKFGASMASFERLADAIMQTTPKALGTDFGVPIFFFQGTDDFVAPAPLTKTYLEQLDAPAKTLVELDAGHFAWINQPETFLKNLVSRVRPLAV